MDEIKSPLKAIKAKCMECSCDSYAEVKECPVTECPLYHFRFGKNPYRKPISDEHRELLRVRALKNFHSRNIEGKNESEGEG